MNEASNQIPKMPPIQTTETFLLECSRSNSIIDKSAFKLQEGESNATWINSSSNFQVRKGDMISIEMIALNLAQTTTPMEFTGENVVLEGANTKPYVDNKVLLEIGYYINNNQTYTNNLPFFLSNGINDMITPAGLPEPVRAVNAQKILPFPDSTAITEADDGLYPGYGMGFGCKFNNTILVAGAFVSAFQRPNVNVESHANSFRIVCFTANDYSTVLPNPLPAGTNAYSVVLERYSVAEVVPIPAAQPSKTCNISTFLKWKAQVFVGLGLDEPCYGKVGMNMAFALDDTTVGFSQKEIVDIRASTSDAPHQDDRRVQVCFPQDHTGFPNSGGIGAFIQPITAGRATCFTTPDIRYSDIFRSQGMTSWNVTSKAYQTPATEPNEQYTQSRQDSGITDFFSNGIQGFITPPQPPFATVPRPLNLAYEYTGGEMTFLKKGGIGSANRLQGTDNLPYVMTRNDFMNGKVKANCEKLGRYATFTPDLRPLTSFIELEATDLLMDATALAAKINEKLHQSLPSVGENSDDINQYHTNVYGFTRRYKKSSQLLPYNNYEGYYPNHCFTQQIPDAEQSNPPATNETGYKDLTYLNTQLWNSLDTYFAGGCKQVIVANYQPGFNKIDFPGYNANLYLDMSEYGNQPIIERAKIGSTYPSFETTYLRTCKKPPDWFGDSCSWNNVIDGNKGYKDIFKAMWGDSFNRIPIWDGNSRAEIGTHQGATSRNFTMPVILNTQLQNYGAGGQIVYPSTYFDLASFDTTLLIKNQMIFTNIYYSEESLRSTEYIEVAAKPDWGSSFDALRQKLVEKQRDYEIYINTANKAADSQIKQQQDTLGWAVELDLGMTDDFLTTKWSDIDISQDSRPIEVNWCKNSLNPPSSSAGSYPNFYTDWGLTPSLSSPWFGSGSVIPQQKPPAVNGVPLFDWNKNQAVTRPVGKIQMQSRFDPDWLTTSNTGGEPLYPNNDYPQLPVSAALNDTQCSFINPINGKPYASDEWSRKNNMGVYPYQYTDVDGVNHIFSAFRVAMPYKAADSATINSQITNTWRIGRLQWGLRFGYSPSSYDNYQVTPMNPDLKPIKTPSAQCYNNGSSIGAEMPVNYGLIQNTNSYIAIGADNPTFRYDPTKSRMEFLQTYKNTQLSQFNATGQAGSASPPTDLPGLGENVSIFNDKCPDAVYSPNADALPIPLPVPPVCVNPSGGSKELNQNQRSEETGIFIYKIWLPNEDWRSPSDINLYSYWSHDEPDGQKFEAPPVAPDYNILPNYQMGKQLPDGTFAPPFRCRDNQDNTENNREEIIKNCIEATALNWRGCLLSKLGFTIEQLLPYQGRQYNRYSVNGYNNPQPDLIVTENTKPLILNCQSNITLDPAFAINYAVTTTEQDDLITNYPLVPAYTTSTPQPPLETVIPAIPSYIQYTPQPDLETVMPAVPATSTVYNYDTEGYNVQLIAGDAITTSPVESNRTINLNNYEFYMNFKDDGLGAVAFGVTGNYTDYNDRSITFDAGANNYIWVRFNEFNLEQSSATMYDRAGITATDTLGELHLGLANLNNTIAPVLSPLFYASGTTNPMPAVWNASNVGGGFSVGYILPNKSSGTDTEGNNFVTHVGTWFQIQARYMRFWFHSDSSVQMSGWDIDICIEKRTAAIPSYIVYTPQPDLETVIPEVPSYIEYTGVPDLITNYPEVPAYFTTEPQPDLLELDTTLSGLPSYGLGFQNGQPVVVSSQDSILTANNPIESTNSPFFQIYSTICNSNYLDNGVRKNIMFYCMKNYQSGNYTYGYGSTYAHTATKSYNLDTIQTEIRNPITGRLMRVLQPNSVLTYKITRNIILAPDVYDDDGNAIDPTDDPIAEDLKMNTDELFNLVQPAQGQASGVAGGGLTAGAVPAGVSQPKTFYFNGSNQVVNLQSDAELANDESLLQNSFAGQGNPSGFGRQTGNFEENKEFEEENETKSAEQLSNSSMSPFNQEIAEQGIIQQQIQQAADQQAADAAVAQVEAQNAPPQIGGDGSPQNLAQDVDRASMSNKVLLYDFLVHTTLNEIIPVSEEMFNSSADLSQALARAYEHIQRFAVGYTQEGGETNPLSDIASLMDQGIISREEGLVQLGDLLFQKVGKTKSSKNTAFMINQNGRRVKRRGAGGTPTDEFFYAIHPLAAKEIGELLSTQRPPTGEVSDRLPTGATQDVGTSDFTRQLEALIKQRIEDNNIVLQENKVSDDGVLSVDTYIHDPDGRVQAYAEQYQFQRVPKEYYSTKKENRSNRSGVMSDIQRLGKDFDVEEYLKAEAGGLGSQYLASIGADIPPDQVVQGGRLDPATESKFAEKETSLGVGERSVVGKMSNEGETQADLRTEGSAMLRAYGKVQEQRLKQAQQRTLAQKQSLKRADGAGQRIDAAVARGGGAGGGGAAGGDGGGEEKKKG